MTMEQAKFASTEQVEQETGNIVWWSSIMVMSSTYRDSVVDCLGVTLHYALHYPVHDDCTFGILKNSFLLRSMD